MTRLESRKIRDIVRELENRVTELLEDFKLSYDVINLLNTKELNIDLENDIRCIKELESMINIFIELKPVEKIVRYKYPEYSNIFTQLTKIEFERQNGKFFSFLAVMPSFEKKRGPKPKNLTQNLIAPAGQSDFTHENR